MIRNPAYVPASCDMLLYYINPEGVDVSAILNERDHTAVLKADNLSRLAEVNL